jgi:crotonobetainyl-CoA:carnitine CoA-transferase CaiB-like acyl-CoA transferase
VKDGAQIFLAAVSDTQWASMCRAFGFDDLLADAQLSSNNDRVRARGWLLPALRERFARFEAAELATRFEANGLPYAPITQPQELFDDPHLAATGGLAPLHVPADASAAGRAFDTRAPLLPLTMDGQRLAVREGPPALGEDTRSVLRELGYAEADIAALGTARVISMTDESAAV